MTTTYQRRSARSVRLVQDALALLENEQRDVPKERRVYPLDAIVRASIQCNPEQNDPRKKGVSISTLKRNPDVVSLIRAVRGKGTVPEPDFEPFGALLSVFSKEARNRRRRAKKFIGLSRSDLAYWIVGYQELDRHLEDVHTQLDRIDYLSGVWPAKVALPNPPFKVSSNAGHRYQQLRTRETVEALRQMLPDLQFKIEEHLEVIKMAQRLYVNQMLQQETPA